MLLRRDLRTSDYALRPPVPTAAPSGPATRSGMRFHYLRT